MKHTIFIILTVTFIIFSAISFHNQNVKQRMNKELDNLIFEKNALNVTKKFLKDFLMTECNSIHSKFYLNYNSEFCTDSGNIKIQMIPESDLMNLLEIFDYKESLIKNRFLNDFSNDIYFQDKNKLTELFDNSFQKICIHEESRSIGLYKSFNQEKLPSVFIEILAGNQSKDYKKLFPAVCDSGETNINFADENYLRFLFENRITGIEGFEYKLNRLIHLRKIRELTEKDLKEIFSPSEKSNIHKYLDCSTKVWKIVFEQNDKYLEIIFFILNHQREKSEPKKIRVVSIK